MAGAEDLLAFLVGWLRLGVEAVGALVVAWGVFSTVYGGLRARFKTRAQIYEKTRVRLAHFLVLGLELQLASDILATAMAPSWEQLGQLAAIAAIRTFLNFFLQREQREMQTGNPSDSG